MKVLVSVVLLAVVAAVHGQQPPRQKDGSCPPVAAGSFGVCSDLCGADGDCPGELRCCPNACGATVCQVPIVDMTPPPPQPPTDPCLEVTCSRQGATCQVVNGQAMCMCPSGCSRFGRSPVCDVSGNEYNNQCVLDAVACQLSMTLETAPCPQAIEPPRPQTTEAPVTEAPATEAPATEAPARPSACALPPKTGLCKAYSLRYYHHAGTGQCLRFVYGGCQSNGNNFRSLAECEQQCGGARADPPPAAPQDVCGLPLDAGPGGCGRPLQNRYYYRSEDQECHRYIHAGCQDNGNSFVSKEACEDRCKPATCAPCSPRWSGSLSRHYCFSHFVITGRVTHIRRISYHDDRSIVEVRVTQMHRGGGLVMDGRTRTAMIITDNQFAQCACPKLTIGEDYILMGRVNGGYGMVSSWNYARPLDSATYRQLMNMHHSGAPCVGSGR